MGWKLFRPGNRFLEATIAQAPRGIRANAFLLTEAIKRLNTPDICGYRTCSKVIAQADMPGPQINRSQAAKRPAIHKPI